MTDYISRADAICEVLVNDGIDNIVDRINALPLAELPKGDLISRADAIEMAVDVETPQGTYERAIYVDDIMALPSADAVEVDRTSEWVAVRREEYEDLIADAEQVTGKLKSVEISTNKGDKSTMSQLNGKLDLISRADAVKALTEYYDYSERMCIEIKALIEDIPSAELPKGDLISRADALNLNCVITVRRADTKERKCDDEIIKACFEAYVEHIKKLPSADAVSREAHYDAVANRITDMEERGFVSVVRCKDCRHRFYDKYNDCFMCEKHEYGESFEDDDYCSWGERKE